MLDDKVFEEYKDFQNRTRQVLRKRIFKVFNKRTINHCFTNYKLKKATWLFTAFPVLGHNQCNFIIFSPYYI